MECGIPYFKKTIDIEENLCYSVIEKDELLSGHGNVTNLTDSSGAVVKTYSYDAFGVEENPSDSDTNPFRYCGEYYDSEIEQIYLRARYYDPSLGRFTQQDPAMADGMNWYTYCGNNPVINVDPSGLAIQIDEEGVEYIHLLTGDTGYQIDENGGLYYDQSKSEIIGQGSETATNIINGLMEMDPLLLINTNAYMPDLADGVDVGGLYKTAEIRLDPRTDDKSEIASNLIHEMVHAFSDFYKLEDSILMSFDPSVSDAEKIQLRQFIEKKYNEAIAITVEMSVRSELGWKKRNPKLGMIGVNDYGQFPWLLTNNPLQLDDHGNPIYGKVKAATVFSISTGIVHYINSGIWRLGQEWD